jgi:dTDP-4-dehydrorhamnose reductase
MRLLVLGANGMLGNAMIRVLSGTADLEVYGTLRCADAAGGFPAAIAERLLAGVDATDRDGLTAAVCRVRPDVVINCIGLVKQRVEANEPLSAIPVNALLPHCLAQLCALLGARLVHISTDCVFSGRQGLYRESDSADAEDLYGRSKYLGEVRDTHCITLRTSIIGHEPVRRQGLIDWFLAQQGACRGYTRAVFSGLPTVVLARLVRDVIIRRKDLHGLYHIAAAPISKYELLKLVADVYARDIELVPDASLVVDRSLNAERFRAATGYAPPGWPELVRIMHTHYLEIAKNDNVQK